MHITETLRIAAQAWSKVKPADDPEFNGCSLSFREKLVAQVERLAATGSVNDDFEMAAKEIMDSQLKAPEPAASKEIAPQPPATTESASVTTPETPAAEKPARRSRKSK